MNTWKNKNKCFSTFFHLLTCPRKGCIEQLFHEGWSLPLSVYVKETVFDPAVASGTITGPWMLKLNNPCSVWMRAVKWMETRCQFGSNTDNRNVGWVEHQLTRCTSYSSLCCLTKTSLRVICAPRRCGARFGHQRWSHCEALLLTAVAQHLYSIQIDSISTQPPGTWSKVRKAAY